MDSWPIALLVTNLVTGAILGLYISELAQRKSLKRMLLNAIKENEEAAKKLSELHNNSVAQLKALGDRSQALEMFVKSSQSNKDDTFMKRF